MTESGKDLLMAKNYKYTFQKILKVDVILSLIAYKTKGN